MFALLMTRAVFTNQANRLERTSRFILFEEHSMISLESCRLPSARAPMMAQALDGSACYVGGKGAQE